MKMIKIWTILLLGVILSASCCQYEQQEFSKLILPVKVIKKDAQSIVLQDSKDNIMQIHNGNTTRWGDSIYRYHKVGDYVGRPPKHTPKEQEKGWLN